MKPLRLLCTCLLLSAVQYGFTQTLIYSEDFETTNSFTQNTSDVSSTSGTSGNNYWLVNNSYNGGSGTVNTCLGPFGFTIGNTPTQPAAITNSPTSNYMHIVSNAAVSNGINCASFMAADGFCTFNEYNFSAQTNDISTVGHDSVEISFYWLCTGGNESYGELYYSTDSGTSWTKVNVVPKYNLSGTWTQSFVSIPAFAQQSSLRFGFRFVNEVTFSTAEPSFSVDEINVNGFCLPQYSTINPTVCDSYSSPSGNYTWTTSGSYQDTISAVSGCDSIITVDLTIGNTTASITETSCFEYVSPSGNYAWTMSGTYQDTIMNTAGCDSIISIDLTINSVDASVSQSGNVLTANATSATYQWLDCDQNYAVIAGETNNSFTAADGNYAVEVTENGCSDTSACFTTTSSAIEDFNQDQAIFSIYPNPADDEVMLQFASKGSYDIAVVSIDGKVILQQKVKGQSYQFSVSDFSNGVYLIKVFDGEYLSVSKLIVR